LIEFKKEICNDLEKALDREWIETNGLGGFASSTIVGLNTRRYHGLLFAAVPPPVARVLLLSKLEETLVVNGERYELSANQFPGVIHPQGQKYLKGFRLDPFPIFTFEAGGVLVEKSVFMPHGENTVVVQYKRLKKHRSVRECRLDARPLVAFRDYHELTHENTGFNSAILTDEEGRARIKPYPGSPELYLIHDAYALDLIPDWYRNFEYGREEERGLDSFEDLFTPCVLRFDFLENSSVGVIASTEASHVAGEMEKLRQQEIDRRRNLQRASPIKSEMARTLTLAADQFIVRRDDGKTVIAGYHWFGDWGRDTMIALPGLTVTTKRFDLAREILLEYTKYVDRGMIPNRFPDRGAPPEYNTVDATLWYFEAARAFVEASGDYGFVRQHLFDVFRTIIDYHARGTRYQIRLDRDGLLIAGEPGVQLTWMDVKIGDWVVTPRIGKPVEIQALWYNAICIMAALSTRFGYPEEALRFESLATRAKESFNRLFWNDPAKCLYDWVSGDRSDDAMRPNQIFAVSLHYSMLDRERSRAVVDAVEKRLWTPYGLRSLATDHPDYKPRYAGAPAERDAAYHQGTVWSWLMGPFVIAYLKAYGATWATRKRAWQLMEGLQDHLLTAGLGQVSEIFDGDAPHQPRGCIAQAWGVAELLRAMAIREK
jgi:predicted glycogen debranching enzyme